LAKKGTKAFDLMPPTNMMASKKPRPEPREAMQHLKSAPLQSDPMSCAFFEARAAMERGEVPVGAVIVRDGAIVSRAGNQILGNRDPTAHAEILAIQQACRAAASERLSGCDLYVTLEPCAMCAAAISFARLRRLYFAAPDPKGGGVEHGPRFFAQPTCHHAPEIYGGIRASEAATMLTGFFIARR
jgi:tRNA(adenine34) deaminase